MTTLVAHKPLAKQAQQILDAMIRAGGIDKRMAMELEPPCWNLPGRIYDIRQAFGDESVETTEHGESRWVTYRFVGLQEAQLSFFASESRDATHMPHAGTSDPYETEDGR